MVDDAPVLEFKQLWFPTRFSRDRLMQMGAEYAINNRPLAGGLSIAEVAWSTGDLDKAVDLLPAIAPQDLRRIVRNLLRPWPRGRYVAAYKRTGGILNMFTPPWGEAQDEVWAAMVAGWKATSFPDDQTRRAAQRALEQQWNSTPHPFFANLTPAQVMVGGGRREAELSDAFLQGLADRLDGQPFVSEGQGLIASVSLLRSWQNHVLPGGRSVFEAIVAERSELLEWRAKAMREPEQSIDA